MLSCWWLLSLFTQNNFVIGEKNMENRVLMMAWYVNVNVRISTLNFCGIYTHSLKQKWRKIVTLRMKLNYFLGRICPVHVYI